MSELQAEMPSSVCHSCLWHSYENGCSFPGKTCPKRRISGMPGRCVGDVLADVGLIPKDWRVKVGWTDD